MFVCMVKAMETGPYHPMAERLAWLAVQPVEELSLEGCRDRLAELGCVTRFVQGLQSRYSARLDQVSPNPENDHVTATRGSKRAAKDAHRRARGRANSGAAGQALGLGMDQGRVSGEHLDAFLAIKATLPPGLHDQFCREDEQIVHWAQSLTVEQFRRKVRHLADDLRRQHGINRLEQQKRNTFLRTWVDDQGMWRLSGALDPETAVPFRAALDAMIETLRAEVPPPCCPHDPVAKQDFLRAHALVRLTQHGAGCVGRGRAELVIIADTTRLDERGQPSLDWGLPVDLPLEALTAFFATVDRTTIIDMVANTTIRDLSHQLDLGRSTRLANRAQRRVLRAFHPTCVVPGCNAHFDHCDIHHVRWWRHGGPTDLANLVPICHRHHERVHRHGWVITLDEQRRVKLHTGDHAPIMEAAASP
jgi:hypothetical protein